ncbi:MAG: M55 family metallopeptidase [Desulfurococcaceae archaeon]
MRAYVSVDLEGLPGVVSGTMLSPWSSQFSRASKIATKLTNIVVDELYKQGFEEIHVADSHGLMTNIDYLELDSRAQIVQGYPRPFSMISGLSKDFTAVFFIGYHAAAGTPRGVLEHTFSGKAFSEVRVNGVKVSEFLVNSLYAGEVGVPVALLAGDEHLNRDVEAYTPWVVFVPLKRGISRYAAVYPSLEKIEQLLRGGIKEACERIKSGRVQTFTLNKPYRVELVLRDSLVADLLEDCDIAERLDAYTVKFVVDSARRLFDVIEISALVAYAVDCLKSGLR